jgi:hypothetical protein
MKKFLQNFAVSLLVWLLSLLIGMLMLSILWMASGWLSGFFGSEAPQWRMVLGVILIPVIPTSISVLLFFFCGRKMKLFNNHWLNFLSVSGSLIIVIIINIFNLFGNWIQDVIVAPFAWLWMAVETGISSIAEETPSNALMYIFLTFPSIITWLGMVYQTRKNKENNVKIISD